MAPHSSPLAWKIPWTEEPGGLQSMGLLGVRHDWVTSLSLFTFMHWRRQWQPTPVFLPGESQGRGSLVVCCLWGHTVGHDWSGLAVAACVLGFRLHIYGLLLLVEYSFLGNSATNLKYSLELFILGMACTSHFKTPILQDNQKFWLVFRTLSLRFLFVFLASLSMEINMKMLSEDTWHRLLS